jgi:alcohol dehydrogenase
MFSVASMMQLVRFHAHGGLDRLRVEEIPTPAPGPGEVLVRLRAVALNGFDPMVLRGIPTLRTPLPMIPCADGAGEVAALGAEATRWREGARVSIVPLRPGAGMMGETLPGVAAQYCAVPESALLPLPDALSFHAAAALPTAWGTAHRMLGRAGIARGERVVVLGAAGGVGTACVQLAAAAGAEVIACVRRAAHVAPLRALGAALVIDGSARDWLAEVLRRFGTPSIWGGGGVDTVIDMIGGDGFARGLAALRRGGRLLSCGASAGPEVAVDLRYVWSFELSITGSNGWSVEDQAALLAMAGDGRLTPPIHAVRPLAAFAEALGEFMDGGVFGKSLLEP